MARRFADSEAVYEYLLGFVNLEKGQKVEFKLDRMRELCAALGNPEAFCPSIHVAGSKGKGSVSVMLANILARAGFKTGLYTSPHLLRWKERICLADTEMPEEHIIDAMEEVLPLVEGRTGADFPGGELPTYFELSTLVAFCAFRRAGCERAVIETGLGGRLDSTNVVDSKASLIMPIELEHTEWLGDTIEKIAAEKAGIIKPGRPCFMSGQVPAARAVIAQAALRADSRLYELQKLARLEDISIDESGTSARVHFAPELSFASRLPSPLRLRSPMIGAIQAWNMALAALLAAETEERVGAEALREGLAAARLPARFQILDGLEPPIILDGAHTPASARLCVESLRRVFPGPRVLLFACARDKRHEELAEILASHFERITITSPGAFKESDPGAVHESFVRRFAKTRLIADTKTACHAARRESQELGLPLLVTGSFYLCAEAAKIWKA